jgi:hypothetical protein
MVQRAPHAERPSTAGSRTFAVEEVRAQVDRIALGEPLEHDVSLAEAAARDQPEGSRQVTS